MGQGEFTVECREEWSRQGKESVQRNYGKRAQTVLKEPKQSWGQSTGLEAENEVAGPEKSAGPDPTEGLVSHGLYFCVVISCLCKGDQSTVYLVGISESF